MSNAIGAARALLTRSYLGVQNALLSARDALRIAVNEGDEELAEQVRARLRHAKRDDLIAEVDGPEPIVRVEVQIDGRWSVDGGPVPRSGADVHFERLCKALEFNGDWQEPQDPDHCRADRGRKALLRLLDGKRRSRSLSSRRGFLLSRMQSGL